MTEYPELARFQVLAVLAERTAGATYKVIDPDDGAVRVVRMVAGESLRDLPVLRRLGRDVRARTSLVVPGLVPWRSVEEHEDRLMIVRDWVDAPSLAVHPSVAAGSEPGLPGVRLGEEASIDLLGRALASLAILHDRGVAALRLSPNNCFLPSTGPILISDWGVRLPGIRQAVAGAPDVQAISACDWSAPEVKFGLVADSRSDQWSLGAIVFELVFGRLPNGGELEGVPHESLGGRLAPVVARLLQRNPALRFRSAREALRALELSVPDLPRSPDASFRAVPTVGRQTEIAELQALVQRLGAGQGELVFVRGEAGVGKTRLVEEVARAASSAGIAVLRGGPVDPVAFPFGRLIPCFEEIARGARDWSDSEVEAALQQDGRVLLEITSSFHDLVRLRELPTPPVVGAEAARRRLLRVAARTLAVLAARTPVMLVIEDLESADEMTLDFVRYLARTVVRAEQGARGAALLVVACYAEVAEARGSLRAAVVALRARGLAQEIVLKPLAPHEVRDLLAERLGSESLPGGFVARVMNETGGIPLKIEETLSWLAALKVLGMPNDLWTRGWDMACQSSATSSPRCGATDSLALLLGGHPVSDAAAGTPTIIGLRLCGLRGDVRRVLEAVATSGDGVAALVLQQAVGLKGPAFDSAVAEAVTAEALCESGPNCLGFRHERLREAVLQTMDPESRRAAHMRLGIAFEQNVGNLDELTPLRLAHHFHQAGDIERSLVYLPLAARILKDRHVPAEALTLFNRFFRHLGGLQPEDREKHLSRRIQALHAMAETLLELRRASEASNVFREMAAVSEASGRERDMVSAWSGLAALNLDMGEIEQARDFGERAAELARKRDLSLLVADNLRVLGRAWLGRQRHGQAIWDLSGALKIYQEQGDVLGEARTYLVLGDAHAARYGHRTALASYREAHRHFRALDDKVGVSQALNRLGRVKLALGDAAKAIAYHSEAARFEREADDREGVGGTLDLLGEAFREKGDLEQALECLREALAIKRELADLRGSADSLLSIAHVTLQAGKVEEAVGLLEQALALARRTANSRAEAGALVRLAQARFQRGDATAAVELGEDGLSRAQASGDRALECRALLVLASAQSDPEQAMRTATRAADAADAVGLGDLIFRARVRLGDLLSAAGHELLALEEYAKALDAASALVAMARSAREGFLRRDDVRASLKGAGSFVAGHTAEDVLQRYPVLKLAQDLEPLVGAGR